MVSGGTMTSSPGFTPRATRAACMVAVPFAKPMANFALNFWAKAFSILLPNTLLSDVANSLSKTSRTYFLSRSPILFILLFQFFIHVTSFHVLVDPRNLWVLFDQFENVFCYEYFSRFVKTFVNNFCHGEIFRSIDSPAKMGI